MAAITIAFINQKGGVGKTSLSVQFSAWLATIYRPGSRVLLADIDPQHNAAMWGNARKGEPLFTVLPMEPEDAEVIHEQHAEISVGYDFLVIDGPANVSRSNGAAILCANLTVVPTEPGAFEIWSAAPILAILHETHRRGVLLVNKNDNTNISAEARAALATLDTPALTAMLNRRTIWREAAATGRTIFEIDKRSDAVTEAHAAFTELMEFVK